MDEKKLITQIELLKNIKPDKKWVSLTRVDILGEKKGFLSTYGEFAEFFFKIPFRVPVLATATALVLLVGVFVYSQILISNNQRMTEELEKIARQNEINALSIALADLKSAREKIKENFADLIVSKPREEVIEAAKEIAPVILSARKTEESIVALSGIIIESDNYSVEKDIASFLITDFEKRSLTEEDTLLLNEAKELFNIGNYRGALAKALEIGKNQIEEVEAN